MLALEATVSAIGYIALALLTGQLVAAGVLLPRDQAATLRTSLFVWARASLLLFLFAALLTLLVQGGKLQRGFPSSEILWRYLMMTQTGKVWLVRELYGFALFLGMWTLQKNHVSRNLVCLLVILVVPLIAARSLTSHAPQCATIPQSP